MSKKKLYNYLSNWLNEVELFYQRRPSNYNQTFASTHQIQAHKLERSTFSSPKFIPGSEHEAYVKLKEMLSECDRLLDNKTQEFGKDAFQTAKTFFVRISPP